MKLEIKHLAPYLPYKLKAEMVDYKIDYVGKKYDKIIGFHQWDKSGSLWSALTFGGSKPNIQQIKPILRPMSNLICFLINDDVSIYKKLSRCSREDFQYKNPCIIKWPYLDLQILFKHHFDVFGLIDSGLAIDINTLKTIGE
jgi:hypothetical protein